MPALVDRASPGAAACPATTYVAGQQEPDAGDLSTSRASARCAPGRPRTVAEARSLFANPRWAWLLTGADAGLPNRIRAGALALELVGSCRPLGPSDVSPGRTRVQLVTSCRLVSTGSWGTSPNDPVRARSSRREHVSSAVVSSLPTLPTRSRAARQEIRNWRRGDEPCALRSDAGWASLRGGLTDQRGPALAEHRQLGDARGQRELRRVHDGALPPRLRQSTSSSLVPTMGVRATARA